MISAVLRELSQRLRFKTKNDNENGKIDNLHFSWVDMFYGIDMNGNFYVYHGSHTHPEEGDCSESVEWIFLQEPIRVTKETVNSFFLQIVFPR